jgi:hypothetical protein
MKRLILCVIALIAIFTIIRAYTEQPGQVESGATAPPVPAARGIELSPGLIEVEEGKGSLSLAFGLMGAGSEGRWNILPLRIVYASGDKSVSIGLNGLSFLLTGGIRMGKPVTLNTATVGDVISIGGKVSVASRVTGDVWAFGADIALGAKAEVTGNVVSIGGKVSSDPHARVGGTIQALPELKLPFLWILSTRASAPTIELARELLNFLLIVLLLFLSSYFLAPHVSRICESVTGEWRRTILTITLSLILIPVFVILLAVSVFGIFFIPFLAIAVTLSAVLGAFAVAVRLGAWLRRGTADSALTVFTSGILGLFIIKAPAFLGIVLTLIRSDIVDLIGRILLATSLGLTVAFLAYGFGSCLSYLRVLASEKHP